MNAAVSPRSLLQSSTGRFDASNGQFIGQEPNRLRVDPTEHRRNMLGLSHRRTSSSWMLPFAPGVTRCLIDATARIASRGAPGRNRTVPAIGSIT